MKQIEDTIAATLFMDGDNPGWIGDFAFSTLPRVGENVFVSRSGEHEIFAITGVTHIADNFASTTMGLREVRGPSIHLYCKEAD